MPNLVLFLNTICNLQQLRMFFNDFFNLVLVCKDIEPRYGRTRTRGFFSTVKIRNDGRLWLNEEHIDEGLDHET